ncbi:MULTISPECIES: dynamin family protein [unclassified Rhodococcus (in: high G+C Gram-positive bacteria)]|uniref:dynamin family protein n=1 Tax=unclassified Rhodococcus (in: high G+C Gram-positive bacteria) TaxID=192944 RepID=UPI0007BC0E02|nr:MULTISPECIES: dynamin family protein [unclassified Rhodococcus (in: high G+C Gram-positive bacteria)]KZE98081.1 Isoniazid-inducible protein iniA [Rhodococcus sp. EPR-147]KZF05232.1 Isoniazid-inducible protein iniA [Rhodococcus sp. EPR-279]MDI6629911.1 dynamin family protein [Rhodococcus sp. (in: high G+C Gram-positive bacteria)]MDI9927107.1 dynamin family protein [Rhodococcus sp. IEGM 1341]MDV7989112.1 dynamin family protein [Rhodococcus sp. IEGM 1374]
MDGQSTELAELLSRTAAVATSAGRSDLVDRVQAARSRVLDPRRRIIVVGPLKQGKSQFVNSLLNLTVCSVGDDETTAIPTVVSNAESLSAQLVLADPGNEPIRVDVPPEEITTVTPASPLAQGREVLRLDIGVASPLLADGLVLVDTPGVGGHGNPHAAGTLGLIPSSDAVLVVSDASREFTEPELSFLRQVQGLCPAVAVLITKIDLYPHWRQIVEANRGHLDRAGIDVQMLPVSSLLRSHALRLNDEELNAESGFQQLYAFLRDDVVARADVLARSSVSLDVRSVTEHLTLSLGSELAALKDPERAAAAVAGLQRAKAAAEELHKRSSQWQQTLGDGIADLASDIDHDLRDRLRRVTREAEETVDEGDPGKDWPQLGEWLEEQIAASVGDNFVWAHERALWLSELVAEHFASSGAAALPDLDVGDLDNVLDPVSSLADLESGRIGITQKVLVGMRGSYGGVLMFGLITTFVGLSLLNPISIGAGVLLGTKAYKEDKENRVKQRRSEAKIAIRRFTDDVSFQVGKESKDRLRQIQRVLRDHFTSIAEQTLRSLNESLRSAQEAAAADNTDRAARIAALENDMRVVAELNARAVGLVKDVAV